MFVFHFGFHLHVGSHNIYLYKNIYVHAVDTAFTNLCTYLLESGQLMKLSILNSGIQIKDTL